MNSTVEVLGTLGIVGAAATVWVAFFSLAFSHRSRAADIRRDDLLTRFQPDLLRATASLRNEAELLVAPNYSPPDPEKPDEIDALAYKISGLIRRASATISRIETSYIASETAFIDIPIQQAQAANAVNNLVAGLDEKKTSMAIRAMSLELTGLADAIDVGLDRLREKIIRDGRLSTGKWAKKTLRPALRTPLLQVVALIALAASSAYIGYLDGSSNSRDARPLPPNDLYGFDES